MSKCQHCGQGAIAQDANGPVCPDCWEGERYETANPMTNETEAPERIWIEVTWKGEGIQAGQQHGHWNNYNSDGRPYVPADLSDALKARIAKLEARLATCIRNATKYANDCVELEAKLAKAVMGLSAMLPAAQQMSNPKMENTIRATLAELKGTD